MQKFIRLYLGLCAVAALLTLLLIGVTVFTLLGVDQELRRRRTLLKEIKPLRVAGSDDPVAEELINRDREIGHSGDGDG